MKEPVFVSPAEIAASKAAAKRVKDEVYGLGLTYHIESYGCQMNEHDSEKIAGMMEEMGYAKAEDKSKADFIYSIPAAFASTLSRGYTAISAR
mgnify:CR=1 FL=1